MGLKMEDLTAEQRDKFDKLMTKAREFIDDEFMLAEEDAYLHFLIKANFDLEEATEHMKEAWDYLWELTEKAKKEEVLEVFHSRKYLPYGHCGFAKNGAEIWWVRTGCCDVEGIWKSAGREGVFNFPFQEWENIYHYIKGECVKKGQNRYRAIIIIDMESFPGWVLTRYEYIKFLYDLRRQFYRFLPPTTVPIVDAVYLINSSTLYRPVIEFVKFFAPYEVIWEKIHIFGKKQSDWLPVLLDKIEESEIPKAYGGSKEGIDDYCSDLICPGGKVPKEYYLNERTK